MLYLKLFYEFFKTGLFTIGGGMATIPFLYRMSDATGWFTYDDLANMKSVVSTINKNYSFNNSENTKVNILTQKDKIISEVNQKLDSTIEKQDINNSVNPVQNNEMEIADNTDEKVGYESSQYQETKLDEIIEENVSDIIPNAEIINQKEIEPTEAKVEVKRKTEVYEVKEEVIDNKTMNNLSEQPTLPLVTENIEIVTTSLDNDVSFNKSIYDINSYEFGYDIGIETINLFKENLKNAKRVLINGPVGVFENKKYAVGTYELYKYLVENNIKTLIGGGDSASSVNNLGFEGKFYHVSTGGGATLEYLEGNGLPGLEVINK